VAALQVVTFIVAAVFFTLYKYKNNPFPLFAQNGAVPKPAPETPGDGRAALGHGALVSCFSSLQKKPC